MRLLEVCLDSPVGVREPYRISKYLLIQCPGDLVATSLNHMILKSLAVH